MRYSCKTLFVAIACLWSWCQPIVAIGAETQKTLFVQTDVECGVYIRVMDHLMSHETTFERRLICVPLTKNNGDAVVYFPKSSKFLCDIHLFDLQGKELPKTSFGKEIGCKFFDLKGYEKGLKLDRVTAGSTPKQSVILDPPIKLFDVEKEGRYVLRMHFQIFIAQQSRDEPYRLIRFAPIEYPLIKK